MSIRLKVECPSRALCKFGDTCLIWVSGRDEGEFVPVLKFRIVRLKVQVRCFSFKEKE